MRKILATIALAAALSLGAGAPAGAKTLRFAFQGDAGSMVRSLLPQRDFTLSFLGNIYEGLTWRGRIESTWLGLESFGLRRHRLKSPRIRVRNSCDRHLLSPLLSRPGRKRSPQRAPAFRVTRLSVSQSPVAVPASEID